MKVSLIIFLVGFITIAPSIYVGIKYFDGKVTDQPYETGLLYDENRKFISDNNIGLNILNHTENGGQIILQFALNCAPEANVESAEFYVTRPATDKTLMAIPVEKEENGLYASVFSMDSKGHHILKAKSRINGKDIVIQKGFYIN